ncbi:MAG: sigma-54-dependent Fis family transcriptional regulator [Candidatus Eisenbacteria bacterium]|uniref:Sigma-54-dependent Fis family transcriptional regulator n=1 Tax=Eiseniibacteriota bacterium TaxID=2212470 RepID=A0A849SLU3_UNCEI|nr:sigma-54-dependent Fis family transcriptional regulator [Candidatus Eisenbacteria bacterium]
MLRALFIDDDADFLLGLAEVATQEGFSVSTARSLAEAREQLANGAPDLVLVDLVLPDGDGIELLRELKEASSSDVILVSGMATVDSAIEALRLGALDYLTKPLDNRRLKAVLAHVLRVRSLKEEVGTLRGELRKFGRFGRLIGVSPAMQKVYDQMSKVAPTDATVFITGESGTGKELVAQTIFELSGRRRKPYLPLDFGSIPQNLIESELFGHERGSFTGATQLRRGCFERAAAGTLFLDEITEMPIELQVKLLRVLESGSLIRVGGDESVPVDVRLIAASNRIPKDALRDGKLREDLYYRINVFPIVLPPLREREGDSLLLADQMLETLNAAQGTSKRLSAEARDRIQAYPWPGNVRELRNEMQRAFIMYERVLELSELAAHSDPAAPAGEVSGSLDEAERHLILRTLEQFGGDKKKAAQTLGISLKTLYNRLHLYAER